VVLRGRKHFLESFVDITERKQAEERYRLLFEISTNAVLIRDREGIIRLANPTAIKMLKASLPDEIIGKAYLNFVHPEDRPGSIDRIQRQLKAVQGESGIDPIRVLAPLREHRLLALDGETIYVESTGVAFRHHGEAWIQGIFHDITRRKQAEEALRKKEEVARRMAHENAIVAEIGRIISSSLSIEDIYERFAEKARQLISFDWISISLIDHEKNTLQNAYNSGDVIPGRGVMEEVSLAGSLTAEVMSGRSSRIIELEDSDEVARRFPKLSPFWQRGYRSFMAIPLISNDQVAGVLHIHSKRSQAFNETDASLGERIAAQIAGAIANAQLFSEHKRTEKALQESELRFRDLYDNAPVGYHEYDTEGRITNVNQTDLDMLGYAREEMIGQRMWKFNVGEEIVRQQIMAKLAGKMPPGRSLVRTYRRKDGTTFPVLIEDRLLQDEKGRITGIRCTIQDITERKQAEEALRRSEEQANRLAQENAIMAEIGRIISSTLDIEEVYDSFAKEALKLIPFDRISINLINLKEGTVFVAYLAGLDVPGRWLGDTFLLKDSATERIRANRLSLLIQPETRGELEGPFPTFLLHFEAGLRSIMAIPLVCRDTVIGVLNLESKKIKAYSDQDLRLAERIASQIAGAIANAQLFAERRRTEEALQASEEKYRLLVQNSNDAIFIAQDGVIKFPNSRAEEFLGYSAAELARIPFVNHIHPDDREMVMERYKKRLERQKFLNTYQFRAINKSGQELWVEINAVFIEWEGRAGTLNFIRDITEKKKLEAQFLQAQKMEAVGTLAGGIAHDFNNLLMGIQGHTSLMLLDIDPSHRHHKMLKSIEEQVKSGADLTWQLLSFARGGKNEVKPTDLTAIIKKSSSMFGRTKKEISIRESLPQDLWPVEVDRGQIEQVLLNLYVNAWQAMPSGGSLFLESKNVILDEDYVRPFNSRPGNYVKISVTDTGVGMDEKTLKRIFEPFFTTKDMGRGTGLGLATVYGIIRGHGGFINVYSQKGHGATFNIYLPGSEKKLEKEKKSPDLLLKGEETILIVDDEEVIINVSRMILEALGYRVFMARSGQEAIEVYKAKKEEIKLVILDMIMPAMGGENTFDLLKTIDPDLKVILSSGYSINDQATRIMERGCQAFIQKPFGARELSQKIREVLDKNVKDGIESQKIHPLI
jgi:PAS domain S-box-containing protein